jgi:hypothetical protein
VLEELGVAELGLHEGEIVRDGRGLAEEPCQAVGQTYNAASGDRCRWRSPGKM